MYYIGIDLGTSAAKFLLVDSEGAILSSTVQEYPLIFPHPGWLEQEPQEWWDALLSGVTELLTGFDSSLVARDRRGRADAWTCGAGQ